MASLIGMPQEESEVSDSVASPYPLERLVACVRVGRACQVAISYSDIHKYWTSAW